MASIGRRLVDIVIAGLAVVDDRRRAGSLSPRGPASRIGEAGILPDLEVEAVQFTDIDIVQQSRGYTGRQAGRRRRPAKADRRAVPVGLEPIRLLARIPKAIVRSERVGDRRQRQLRPIDRGPRARALGAAAQPLVSPVERTTRW